MYGPVRTVVWQGSVGDRRPYANQILLSLLTVMANASAVYLLLYLKATRAPTKEMHDD